MASVGVAAEGVVVFEPAGGGVCCGGAGVDGGDALVGAVAVGAVVGVGVGVVLTGGVLVGVVEGWGGGLDLVVRLGRTATVPGG